MMKQLILFFCFFVATTCQAQTILNASGNTATVSGNTYTYSIGEMCAVHTATSATIIVTNGLLQPITGDPIGLQPIWLASDKINLYPNPSTAILNLEMQTNEMATGKINLIDMTGRVILSRQETFIAGSNKLQFDLTPFANAQYVLQIQLSKSNQQYSKSFNIQKIK